MRAVQLATRDQEVCCFQIPKVASGSGTLAGNYAFMWLVRFSVYAILILAYDLGLWRNVKSKWLVNYNNAREPLQTPIIVRRFMHFVLECVSSGMRYSLALPSYSENHKI